MAKDRFKLGSLKCPDCGSKCGRTTLKVEDITVNGWQCESCGYELIDPAEIEQAYFILRARKKEAVKISKRGNSFMVTIPKRIVEVMGIKNHSDARICMKDKRTIEIEV